MTYYSLPSVIELGSLEDFELIRAKQLYNALDAHQDFSIVKLLKSNSQANEYFEIFIVEIECHEIPPQNPFGLLFKERVALKVPKNELELVDVVALRRSFPKLIHRNGTPQNSPISLCLYFEPIASIRRTWTAENFLRRIQWWIEKSSTGSLHPSDQPLEQFFYKSFLELVLPWNFDELVIEKAKFHVFSKGTRSNGTQTCFIEPLKTGSDKKDSLIDLIQITAPTTIHGQIEYLPSCLFELVEILKERRIDLLFMLREEIRSRVKEDGESESKNERLTVVFLRIPISREENLEPEKIKNYAFASKIGIFDIGLKIDALIFNNKKYFSSAGILGEKQLDYGDLKKINLDCMDVLYCNRQEDFRAHSGTRNKGPKASIVGVGALGSSLIDLWARSGWGTWTAIDNDHIKPHNISRHTANHSMIGENKAEVVSFLYNCITNEANPLKSLATDATDFSRPELKNCLTTSELVIDCSTTLEYPRAISSQDELPRHFSVFMNPQGSDAVFLGEDSKRKIRLRSLEAQYYRAVINESWGENHLTGNKNSFWSGASCRDISVVLPYSSIVNASSILSEQIPKAFEEESAKIAVWSRNRNTSETVFHEVVTYPEKIFPFKSFTLSIDQGLIDHLSSMRKLKLPNETGGILLGYYDLSLNVVVIVSALNAPIDSDESATNFSRGTSDLLEQVESASKRTAGIVQYIGEWHSHPNSFSTEPSNDDLRQLAFLADEMSRDGLPAVQLIVGDIGIGISQAFNSDKKNEIIYECFGQDTRSI